jgi:hypothetical protein
VVPASLWALERREVLERTKWYGPPAPRLNEDRLAHARTDSGHALRHTVSGRPTPSRSRSPQDNPTRSPRRRSPLSRSAPPGTARTALVRSAFIGVTATSDAGLLSQGRSSKTGTVSLGVKKETMDDLHARFSHEIPTRNQQPGALTSTSSNATSVVARANHHD